VARKMAKENGNPHPHKVAETDSARPNCGQLG